MGGITDVDRGVCEAPRRQGLADPAFLAAMQSRMERIMLLKDRHNVRRELRHDVEAGNRAGRVGSSVARANLAGAGSRQFDNEEEQLLYLRFTLQMELEDDHPATLPGGYYEGAAIDPDWIASAMVDFEVSAMRLRAEQVAPVPPGRSYAQPPPAGRSYLKPPAAPAQLDFMMVSYVDSELGIHDPDELGSWSPEDFAQYARCLLAQEKDVLSASDYAALQSQLTAQYQSIVSNPQVTTDTIIVPTQSLYIEALPGAHPLLEGFKLEHRAIDVQAAAEDPRKKQLESLRYAARILANDLTDPDVDKQVVIEGGTSVSVADTWGASL